MAVGLSDQERSVVRQFQFLEQVSILRNDRADESHFDRRRDIFLNCAFQVRRNNRPNLRNDALSAIVEVVDRKAGVKGLQ
jgi:hypothetical protein